MLGVSFLNEIVNKEQNLNAAEILNLLRNGIITTLSQQGVSLETSDGIDLAICVIDFDKKIMEFSGAYNPVLLVRNNLLSEYKANRMPVGIFTGPMKPFTNHVIDLLTNDRLYLFTDGFADQFGGPENKKIKMRNFRKILLNIHQKPMKEQRSELDKVFKEWKGSSPQIDDVLVIGVGIN
jgi:serine phosphatase RsbU (regulator of sigma subunit)